MSADRLTQFLLTRTPGTNPGGWVLALSFINTADSTGLDIRPTQCSRTVDDSVAGTATNYSYSLTETHDTGHFSQPSFPLASGALSGGSNGTPTQASIYSFNISSFTNNGDILGVTDLVNGSWTYTYDEFERLKTAKKGTQTWTYAYDPFSNRWQESGPSGNLFSQTFDSNNHITGTGQNCTPTQAYCYDAAGNLLNDGAHTYLRFRR